MQRPLHCAQPHLALSLLANVFLTQHSGRSQLLRFLRQACILTISKSIHEKSRWGAFTCLECTVHKAEQDPRNPETIRHLCHFLRRLWIQINEFDGLSLFQHHSTVS